MKLKKFKVNISDKKKKVRVALAVAAAVCVVFALFYVPNFFGRVELTAHLGRIWTAEAQDENDSLRGDKLQFRNYGRSLERMGRQQGVVDNNGDSYGIDYKIKSGSRVKVGDCSYRVKLKDTDKNGVVETMVISGKGPLAGEWTTDNSSFRYKHLESAAEYIEDCVDYVILRMDAKSREKE